MMSLAFYLGYWMTPVVTPVAAPPAPKPPAPLPRHRSRAARQSPGKNHPVRISSNDATSAAAAAATTRTASSSAAQREEPLVLRYLPGCCMIRRLLKRALTSVSVEWRTSDEAASVLEWTQQAISRMQRQLARSRRGMWDPERCIAWVQTHRAAWRSHYGPDPPSPTPTAVAAASAALPSPPLLDLGDGMGSLRGREGGATALSKATVSKAAAASGLLRQSLLDFWRFPWHPDMFASEAQLMGCMISHYHKHIWRFCCHAGSWALLVYLEDHWEDDMGV